jgi:molybdopterin-binding protein
MRISARNQIRGSVVSIKRGATTSHVRVDIGTGMIGWLIFVTFVVGTSKLCRQCLSLAHA